MKATVDLTVNRDFRSHNTRWSSLPGHLPYKPLNLLTHLTKEEISDDDIDHWGIKQGNALKRKVKSFNEAFCDFITCDRCGRYLFPYYHDGLCVECKEDMSYKKPVWMGR